MPEIFRLPLGRSDPPPLVDTVFVGWEQEQPSYRTLLMASREDSVAVLGPPRSGKTSGVLIPQAMTWGGSLISASTKPDVLRATRGRRLEVAVLRDGDVYVYAPADSRRAIAGARAIRWSPIDGCADPTVCEIRVQKMLGPEKPNDDQFFRQAGATVLRGYFHAAALAKQGGEPCGMRSVKRWVDNLDVREAISILRHFEGQSLAAGNYADALDGIGRQPGETKAGTFGTVNEKLAAIVGNATALANADEGNFDIERFLQTGSTLYIVSPEDTQGIVAPLVAGLIEAIVSQAYRYASQAQDGRLDPPLLMLLDEVGAIAPLPSLPAIMGQGAGQGVLCVWAAQAISQLRARWGEEWAKAIWGASSQKLIFGNLADSDLLESISALFGEYDRRVYAQGNSPVHHVMAALSKTQITPQIMKERNLQVSQLHGRPPGTASLLALTPKGPAVVGVGTPPAGRTPPFSACQQAEAAVQGQLDGDVGPTPDELREHALADAIFASMPSAEQGRFRREEAALMERLTRIQSSPPASRQAMLGADPVLAAEATSFNQVSSQPRSRQVAFRRELIARFAQRTVPHFTFTVFSSPKPRRVIGRPPDRYSTVNQDAGHHRR